MSSRHHRPRVLTRRTCDECAEPFEYLQGHKGGEPREQRFCSNTCRLVALQRIPRPRKGRGNGHLTAKGYRSINVVDDGRVRIISEHRYVMEQHLGRRLLRSEVVHHRNHDRADNRIENLELVSSHADHIREHHPNMRRGKGALLGERWSRNYDACVTCGRTDSEHRGKGVCGRCMEAARRAGQPKGMCSVCGLREVRYGGSGVCRSCAMKASRAER